MHWITILVIGIAANLDNLGIGLSFGARKTIIPFGSNLLIAVLSMVAAYVSMMFGWLISGSLPTTAANLLGGGMIGLIGLWSLATSAREAYARGRTRTSSPGSSLLSDPSKADKDGNNILSMRECWVLGLALSLNCLASGFGAGASGISIWGTTLSIGVFSMLTVGIGARLGSQIAKSWLGRYSNAVGGLLLLAIGIYEILQ